MSMGVERTAIASQQRKIIQTNTAALLAMVAGAITALVFWDTRNAALVRGAWLNLPFLFLYPAVWLLNYRGRSFFACWALFALAMAQVMIGIFFVQGTVLLLHYYLLVFAIMSPLLFPAKRWRSDVFLLVVNVGVFVYVDLRGVAALPALAQMDPDTLAMIRRGVVGSCLTLFILLVRVSEYSANLSEWRLQQLASSDPLTGLPNRLALHEAFARELARRQREASPMSFAMADIDFFKRVNDEWGHEAGDRALCHVSAILRAQVRAGELVSRMGGEEFGIILLTDPEKATLAAERMCRALEAAPFEHEGKSRTITISIGLVHMAASDDEQSALRRADEALYVAKHHGRNQVAVAPAAP
jgi:diguanylate cyclase (GGDEF)-like protein